MRFFSLLLCLAVLVPALSLAVGVSPPSYKLDYTSSGTYELKFAVRNNAGQEQAVSISTRGDLSAYATLSDSELLIPKDRFGEFTVSLQLPPTPEDISPGRHEIEIFIRELSDGGSGIAAKTGVISSIYIFIPYPGRYAEISGFTVESRNIGEDTPVSFSIINRGQEDLTDTTAILMLQSHDNTTLQTVSYPGIDIPTEKSYSESFTFKTATLPASDYKATLTYTYDDKELTAQQAFMLGHFNVTITDYPAEVEQGGIVPFPFTVKSLWKGDIYVTATVSVAGTAAMRTSREPLKEFQALTFQGYMDTTPLELGPQEGVITLSAEKQRPDPGDGVLVQSFPITFELVKASRSSTSKFSGTTTIILSAMIVLLLASLVILALLLKKKKKGS